jgi:hypothetical protein
MYYLDIISGTINNQIINQSKMICSKFRFHLPKDFLKTLITQWLGGFGEETKKCEKFTDILD